MVSNLFKMTHELSELRMRAAVLYKQGVLSDDFDEFKDCMVQINALKHKISLIPPSERKGAE